MRSSVRGEIELPCHEPRGNLGRDDGPVHVAEPAGEEGRRRLLDRMVRLEPGREGAAGALRGKLAEADEGVHLVDLAPNHLLLRKELAQRGIAPVAPAQSAVRQPQEKTVGTAEPLGIGVAEGSFQ